MWKYQNTDELYHYGVLGMKWGQHIFGKSRNPDGSLTPAGYRRAKKYAKKYAKVTGKKLIVKTNSVEQQSQRPKTISEMSDAELIQKINRSRLEEQYRSILLSQLPKQKVSRGKRFINNIKRNVISPALIEAGRAVLTNFIKKKGNDLVYRNNKSDPKKERENKIKDLELDAREFKAKNSLNYEKFINNYYKENNEPFNSKLYYDNKNKNKNNNKNNTYKLEKIMNNNLGTITIDDSVIKKVDELRKKNK